MGLDIGQYRGAEGKFELVDIIFYYFFKKLFLTKHKNYFWKNSNMVAVQNRAIIQ
jgi:hypothetical protein